MESILKNNALIALFMDTLKKEIRSKTLITLFVIVTIGMFLGYKVISSMNDPLNNNAISILGNFSFNAMFFLNNVFSTIVALILGTSAVRSDFKEKIAYTIMTLPISRMEYFYTRVFGVWLMSMIYYVYTFLLGTIFLSLIQKGVHFNAYYLLSLLFSAISIFVVLNIVVLFSFHFNQMLSIFLSVIFLFLMDSGWGYFSNLTTKNAFQDFGVFDIVRGFFYLFTPHSSLYKELNSMILINENPFIEIAKYNWPFEIVHLVLTFILMIFVSKKLINRIDF